MGLYTRCLGLLFAIGLSLTALSCGGGGEEQGEALRPVRYTKVSTMGNGRIRNFTGIARAGVESKLSFKVSGTISNLPITLGDHVQKGELIAEIDPSDYLVQKQEAEASLLSAQATARSSGADYNRVKALYENNNASRGELDNARAMAESSNAQVGAAKKRLELADLQLSYTRLHSPVDGGIAEVLVEVNENISSGQTIATVTSGSNPEVTVGVPEILIADMISGSEVAVRFDAIPDRTYKGVITEVGVASMRLATTFPVTISIEKVDDRILPGMAAEVAFEFKSDEDAEYIVVPTVSVGEDKLGRYVYVLETGDTENKEGNGYRVAVAKRKEVVTGGITPEGIEILEGLDGSELVVTAGVRRITDGQQVKLTYEFKDNP